VDRADAVGGSDEEGSGSGSGTEVSSSDSEGEGPPGGGGGGRRMGKKAAAKLQAAAAGILEGAPHLLLPGIFKSVFLGLSKYSEFASSPSPTPPSRAFVPPNKVCVLMVASILGRTGNSPRIGNSPIIL